MPRWLLAGGLLFALVLGSLLVSSLSRPTPSTFLPTPPAPSAAGDSLIWDRLYTIDARDAQRWVFFDFSRSSVVVDPGPLQWDLAVRRFHLITNGGPSFPGGGGVIEMPGVDLDSLTEAPRGEYVETAGSFDSNAANPVLDRWYRYGYVSHLLEPRPRTYVFRTADGRYAKLKILSYYCPGAVPGCLTFRYTYQGAGGRRLTRAAPPPESSG
ncbi:MAG: HmuY family protein [Gemmatimonadota bacterium]